MCLPHRTDITVAVELRNWRVSWLVTGMWNVTAYYLLLLVIK